jgi:peptide/nickel transport system permease protein
LFRFLGLIGVTLLFVAGVFAPILAPYPVNQQRLEDDLESPSREHLLGTDKLGRDTLSRIVFGSRISLQVGMITVGVSLALGLLVGSAAGIFGGWVDELLMRFVDLLMAFPGTLLAITLTSVLTPPSLTKVIFALSLVSWTGYARLVRGEVLSLREREFVQAARALGASPPRLIARHILPNLVGPLAVQGSYGMASAIVAEAGLSFLGLGAQPPTPSWGVMLNEGRQFLLVAPHMTLFPGLAIMLVILGFNLLGDGLRDRLDVRVRGR